MRKPALWLTQDLTFFFVSLERRKDTKVYCKEQPPISLPPQLRPAEPIEDSRWHSLSCQRRNLCIFFCHKGKNMRLALPKPQLISSFALYLTQPELALGRYKGCSAEVGSGISGDMWSFVTIPLCLQRWNMFSLLHLLSFAAQFGQNLRLFYNG